MMPLRGMSPSLVGGISASVAVVFFSINDVLIKFLSDGYALHEVVFIRSVIGLVLILIVVAPLSEGWAIFRTKRLGLHLLRGLCVVTANMTFFLGLAAMPLAEAVAIFFISPLLITAFSVVFLGETVGPRRWVAILVGLLGVLLIVRPGSAAFQIASLLPAVAAVAYAFINIIARRLGSTESAGTMSVYIQIVMIAVSLGIGLMFGDGRFMDQSHPSLAFFFRPWIWPSTGDWPLLMLLGIAVALGSYLISHAYRVAEAGFVAPFEYLAVILAVIWGYLVFGELPDALNWLGIVLIVGSGLFAIWRERKVGAGLAMPPSQR